MEITKEIIDYWESDISLSTAWQEVYDEVEKTAVGLQDVSILDVGCGQSKIGKFFNNYTGMDISIPALKMALKNNPENRYVRGDGLYLPFKNNTFDYVVCTDVIEHVKDKDRILKELSRVSKNYLLITTPIKGTSVELFRIFICKLRGKEYFDTPYEYRMTEKEVKKILKKHDLSISDHRYVGFRLPFLRKFKRLNLLEKKLYKAQIMKGYILFLSLKKIE